jgi:DNA replication protein DnaC
VRVAFGQHQVGMAELLSTVAVAAMIDRLIHHTDVIALKGDSYRLKDSDLGRVPAATTSDD